jgi:hypothetical protein
MLLTFTNYVGLMLLERWLIYLVYRTTKNPDDIVITLAFRTPLTKAYKGGLKDTPLDGIIFKIMQQVVQRMNVDPAIVEDICLGNVCFRP